MIVCPTCRTSCERQVDWSVRVTECRCGRLELNTEGVLMFRTRGVPQTILHVVGDGSLWRGLKRVPEDERESVVEEAIREAEREELVKAVLES